MFMKSKLKRIKCLDNASLVALLDMIYVQEFCFVSDALETIYLFFKDISFARGQRTVTKYLLNL